MTFDRPAKHAVTTLGVFRSASTWVANVSSELLRTTGPSRIVYADRVQDLPWPETDEAYVLKMHRPDADLKRVIRASRAPLFISTRDPADCVASMMEQLRYPFAEACGMVVESCDAIVDLSSVCRPLILRYEGPNACTAQAIAAIATHLRIPLPPDEAAKLARRYSLREVRRLIDALTSEGRFGGDPDPRCVDPATHWHFNHVGAGLSGRHASLLAPAAVAEVRRRTRAFSRLFDYP